MKKLIKHPRGGSIIFPFAHETPLPECSFIICNGVKVFPTSQWQHAGGGSFFLTFEDGTKLKMTFIENERASGYDRIAQIEFGASFSQFKKDKLLNHGHRKNHTRKRPNRVKRGH